MRDRWYADSRDLIKWGVLLRLAESFDARRVLQRGSTVLARMFHAVTDFGR